jgi:glycosyltransferase involved in cell wall biosynthesis
MKRFVLAVFLDHKIESGGNFQQSLNNILLTKKLEKNSEIDLRIITTERKNEEILKKYDLKYLLYETNIFVRLWMQFRETSSNLIYRLISLLSKKNHFEKFLEKNKVDLIYFVAQSHFTNYVHSVNYIFTLFDLCHRDNPEFPEIKNNRIFEFREVQFQKNLSRAIAVLVESDLGKNNAIYRYRLEANRVYIFPVEPAPEIKSLNINSNDKLKNEKIDIKKKYNLDCNYIFYPAQFWAHKNHIYILKALNIFQNENSTSLGAIFSGSDQGNLSYIKDMTKKFNLEKKVIFTGFVSNEEIKDLYLQSFALVMPTYFGPTNMPPLEAFKLNVPVMYPDLPGLKDQVSDAALLLDLNEPHSLVLNLKKLLNSNELRNSLINKGKERYNEIVSNNNNYNVLKKIINDFKSRRDCWK